MEKSSLNQIIETAGLLLTDCVVLFFIWNQLNSKLQFTPSFSRRWKTIESSWLACSN